MIFSLTDYFFRHNVGHDFRRYYHRQVRQQRRPRTGSQHASNHYPALEKGGLGPPEASVCAAHQGPRDGHLDRRRRPDPVRQRCNMTSIIYFVRSSAGPIKIGVTKNIRNRLQQIQGQSPHKVSLISAFCGSSVLEREIHKRFSDGRLFGEWFSCSPQLIAYAADHNDPEAWPKEMVNKPWASRRPHHPLERWLFDHRMRRVEFARRIGTAQSYITELCQGKKWPSRETVIKIQAATEGAVTANDFVELPWTE